MNFGPPGSAGPGGPPGGMGMMPNMFAGGPHGAMVDPMMEITKNPLHICHKLCENPNELHEHNILDFFCKCPPHVYDPQCDNEVLRMQRQPQNQLASMQGIQYALALANKPLFVIRKVKRQSPTEVIPLAEYYVINGVIYQSPDLASVVNSRLSHSLFHVREAFEESYKYVKYNPSKGYSWNFASTSGDNESSEPENASKSRPSTPPHQVRCTLYQRTRVDSLLAQLTKQFPPPTQSDGLDDQAQQPPDMQQLDVKSQADDAQSTASSSRLPAEPSAKRVKAE